MISFSSTIRSGRGTILLFLGLTCALWAQGPPPTPVRYTAAREHDLRQTLTLPGSVEAQTSSIIASSVEGLVSEFPAKEGMRVSKGQVLAQLRTGPRELQLAARRASLQEAEARLKLAENNLARSRELFAAGVVSQQQLDDNQSEFTAWQGRADSLRAEIAAIQDDIERATIRSPLAGVVSRERTEVGQWMEAGGPVVELLALDTVEIRVEVPERYFASVKTGSSATVTVDSLPGFETQGRVVAVIPQADAQARSFPVKVRVANQRRRLAAGMLAKVSFPAGETYRTTVVPKDAIVSRGASRFLFKVNGSGTVDEVPVETGAGVGAWVEVRGSVSAGDKVVTRGNERIQPGQAVQAAPLEYKGP
ncbi:MAG: efflux RND transporter periplasmic adaptor subunit [Terriglobales bacterium]